MHWSLTSSVVADPLRPAKYMTNRVPMRATDGAQIWDSAGSTQAGRVGIASTGFAAHCALLVGRGWRRSW